MFFECAYDIVSWCSVTSSEELESGVQKYMESLLVLI